MSQQLENIILILIALSQVVVLIIQYRKKRKRKDAEKTKSASVAKEYPYEGLRNMAINATPGAMLLSLPENTVGVYGIVIDWYMGDDIVTLIAYLTGDASMYVKSGGGIIGGGMHKYVVIATQQLIAVAQTYIDKATPAASTPLPDKATVRFYLLTNKGKYTMQEQTRKLEDKSSEWTALFEEGQKVIAELHKSVMTSKA